MSSVVSQANMESKNHNQAETKTPDSESAPVSTSLCERKFDENSGVMTNIRIRMSDFIHAPMDERKACLKETYQKVIHSWDNWKCCDMFESFKSVFTFKKKE